MHPMRLLVVEDDKRLAATSSGGSSRRGTRSTAASTGRTVSGRANDLHYDAIVLDVMLPGMNGYRLCGTLRSEATGPRS